MADGAEGGGDTGEIPTVPPAPPVVAPAPKRHRGRTVLLVGLAVIVVAGVAAGGYFVGKKRNTTEPAAHTAAAKVPLSTTTTPTTASASDDIPISYFNNSASGLIPTTCQVSADGTTVIALGSFTASLVPAADPSYENAYSVQVGVYDDENAEIGYNTISFGPSSLDQNWQVNVTLNQGFTPTKCYAALVVVHPATNSGTTGSTGNTP